MRLLLIFALLATSALAGEWRDGTDWTHLRRADKDAWVAGWMDGLNTGTAYAVGVNKLLEHFKGMSIDEIRQGLDQFYAADYRNLPVMVGPAALLVAEYSRGGLDSKEAVAMIEKLRETSKSNEH